MKDFDHTKAIFVFGSNEGGYHGAGAAKFALERKGAILYTPFGLQGQSFAIPTKDASIRNTLPLDDIRGYVNTFLVMAADKHKDLQFQVTRIGCGLAGLRDDEIAPMFTHAPENCWFDEAWKDYLDDSAKFWGSK